MKTTKATLAISLHYIDKDPVFFTLLRPLHMCNIY